MTTNTMEQAVPEVTARALLTQHALRVNCAVRAPCKVSSIYTHCSSYVRSFVRSYVCSLVRSFVRSFLPLFFESFVCSSTHLFFLLFSFVLIHGRSRQIISNEQNVELRFKPRSENTMSFLALQGCSTLFQLTLARGTSYCI